MQSEDISFVKFVHKSKFLRSQNQRFGKNVFMQVCEKFLKTESIQMLWCRCLTNLLLVKILRFSIKMIYNTKGFYIQQAKK